MLGIYPVAAAPLAGSRPQEQAGVIALAGSGSIELAGSIPIAEVSANVAALAQSGAIELTGSQPVAVVSNNVEALAGSGSIELAGSVPVAAVSAAAVALAGSGLIELVGSVPVAEATRPGAFSGASGRRVGTSYAYKTLTELREEEALRKLKKKVRQKVERRLEPGVLTAEIDLAAIARRELEKSPAVAELSLTEPMIIDVLAMIMDEIRAREAMGLLAWQEFERQNDDLALALLLAA